MTPQKVAGITADAGARAPKEDRSMIDLFQTNGSSPPTPDFDVIFHGSVVSFAPLTPAARTWIADNVHIESWQYLGDVAFVVDHRFAQPLIDGILDAGLEGR